MAAFGTSQTPNDIMRPVRPRNGLPVPNMGGIPQAPTLSSPRPFVPGPTVAAGPPGPAPAAGISPPPAPVPPAAPPSPVPPPAPPAVASPTSTSTSSTTSSSGQTPVVSPQAGGWNLEGQLQNYLTGAFQGSVSPEFTQRAREQVFRNVQGQTRQATNRINEDAVRRGLYRSGIPAEGIANVEAGAQGAIASGVADILNSAENQNIQGRQNAAGVASNVLGMNREQSNWETQRADAAAARAAAGRPQTFTYIDPDTGQSYEMDESWF